MRTSVLYQCITKVDATLRAVGKSNIFAAGDVASLPSPRPKAGVFAVKSGPPLAANIRRVLVGNDDQLERYDPQTTFLGVIGTGRPECAVASKSTCAITAGWVWDLRDWIDRKWMAGCVAAATVFTCCDACRLAVTNSNSY